MKWQEKTKEQKNILVLIGLLSVAVLFIAYQFGLNPLFSGKAKVAQEVRDLQAKLAAGEEIAGREEKISQEVSVSNEEQHQADEHHIVPRENPLSWVTEKVYFNAREVGIEIDSVAEVGSPLTSRERTDKQQKNFGSYSVRIVAQCGYRDLIRLVKVLETSNPYLCVSGISVVSQDRTAEKHLISLVVEWPMRMAAGAAKSPDAAGHKPVL
ncbi:MAG TPA: hypothetical protein DCZ95_17220 [Verrucomicrobia bacterium]|nr:MAG: hypothetical protein A2X46_09700 [Lentisphaerae bacterium GWF2_57_35]HBA85826.1 hypothetical protein [Verrucomicrobiota bacterium]